MASLYEIVRQVRHSYKIKLLELMKIYPMFSLDKLRKATNDPLPGQRNDPPPLIEITGDKEWEVDKILVVRKTRKILFYRAKWVGHDEDLEWYPARDFKYSPH